MNEKFNIVGKGVLIKYCSNESQITIPNSVTFIDWGAFTSCDNLPEDVVQQTKQINPSAFG